MKPIRTDKYLYIFSESNPKRTYQIDRYADYHKGDSVAVNHGKLARIEPFNNQNNVMGKAINVTTPL